MSSDEVACDAAAAALWSLRVVIAAAAAAAVPGECRSDKPLLLLLIS